MGSRQRKGLAKRSKKGASHRWPIWADRGRLLQAFETRGYTRKGSCVLIIEDERAKELKENLCLDIQRREDIYAVSIGIIRD